MSERPSSARSSLTLSAADEVSWMKLVLVCVEAVCSFTAQVYPEPAIRPRTSESSLPEVGRNASGGPEQLLRADPEHGVGRAGSRPHLRVAEQVPVYQDRQGSGMAKRGCPADGEPGGLPGLLGGSPPNRRRAGEGGQLTDIRPVRAAGEGQDGPVVGHEHQRLHDLANLAPHGPGRVGSGPGPLGEPPDVDGQPECRGRVLDSPHGPPSGGSRLAHGTDPTRRSADRARPSATSRSAATVSPKAPAGPTSATREITGTPSRLMSACPHTTATGFPARRAAARTPAGTFPRSDCSSSLPSPVITRSAETTRSANPTASITTSTPGRTSASRNAIRPAPSPPAAPAPGRSRTSTPRSRRTIPPAPPAGCPRRWPPRSELPAPGRPARRRRRVRAQPGPGPRAPAPRRPRPGAGPPAPGPSRRRRRSWRFPRCTRSPRPGGVPASRPPGSAPRFPGSW